MRVYVLSSSKIEFSPLAIKIKAASARKFSLSSVEDVYIYLNADAVAIRIFLV
jgi:hypothetical protein